MVTRGWIFMKQWTNHLLTLGGLMVIISLALYSHGDEAWAGITWGTQLWPNHQERGIFDPQGIFDDDKNIHYELLYFDWNKTSEMLPTVNTTLAKKRVPVITIEPWQAENARDTDLLRSVIAGRYDKNIDSICSDLDQLPDSVILRWGHEMELTNGRYPWSGKDPDLYKSAYIHFVDQCRISDPERKILFMWSPSGDAGAEKYWPKDDTVDIIGVSVFSYDIWEKGHLGYQRSFDQIFSPKYELLEKLKKPIMIAEMGVTGTTEYKQEWLTNMKIDASTYKNLIGYIYFNSKDTESAWGPSIATPDWRITRSEWK